MGVWCPRDIIKLPARTWNLITVHAKLHRALSALASIAVGIIPVFVLIYYFGVPRKLIIGWGVLSYIVGVTAFKMPIYHFIVVKMLHGRLSNFWLSVSQGLVSALSELGSAFLFFVLVVRTMTLTQLIGFGVAAGAVEAVMLPFIQNPLKGTPLEKHSSEVSERSSTDRLIPWMAVLERGLAFLPHVASRGLLYISFSTANIVPGLLGILTFASIDGRAYYAHLERWQFDNLQVLAGIYRYLGFVGAFQTVCFGLFYHFLM